MGSVLALLGVGGIPAVAAGGGGVLVNSTSTVHETSGASATFSFNNVAGTTILVMIAGFGDNVTGVTYNGDALSQVVVANNVNQDRCSIWRRTGAVDTGTNNVVISTDGSMEIYAVAVSLTGEDSGTPVDDFDSSSNASGAANTATPALTSQTGGLVFDVTSAYNPTTLTRAGGLTVTLMNEPNGGALNSAAAGYGPGSASFTAQWNFSPNSSYVHCAVAIAPA